MKFVPLMVTTVPAAPLVGVNEMMLGAGMKVNVPVLVAVPPAVVTVIVPVAPLPTVAVMVLSFTTVKAVADAPPKATAVAPVKPLPVILSTAPTPPLAGVNAVMAGAGI